MKNIGKLVSAVISLAIVIGLIILAVKLLSGAIHLVGGVLNGLLGVVVIVALVAIVIWMFSYAKKH